MEMRASRYKLPFPTGAVMNEVEEWLVMAVRPHGGDLLHIHGCTDAS